MNETEWILWGVIAFGVGYAFARFAKNIGNLAERWGLFIALFAFPVIVMWLMVGAAKIAMLNSAVVSGIFAAGFLLGMFRRR